MKAFYLVITLFFSNSVFAVLGQYELPVGAILPPACAAPFQAAANWTPTVHYGKKIELADWQEAEAEGFENWIDINRANKILDDAGVSKTRLSFREIYKIAQEAARSKESGDESIELENGLEIKRSSRHGNALFLFFKGQFLSVQFPQAFGAQGVFETEAKVSPYIAFGRLTGQEEGPFGTNFRILPGGRISGVDKSILSTSLAQEASLKFVRSDCESCLFLVRTAPRKLSAGRYYGRPLVIKLNWVSQEFAIVGLGDAGANEPKILIYKNDFRRGSDIFDGLFQSVFVREDYLKEMKRHQ